MLILNRVSFFRDIDYTQAVGQMHERGAYARATGFYLHSKKWPGMTFMVLKWKPRIERNEGGRFN